MRLLEVKQPNIIVVYGGGFQPFHEGHASSYREAKAAFPGAYFFVAASNVTSERPFEFKEKQFLAKQAGVVDPFIQVGTMSYVNDNGRKVTSTPLNPLEVLKQFNPEKYVLIIVRSERDPMKTTDVSYYQPWQGIQGAEPFSKHAYVLVTKKHDFTIAGNPVYSGSQVRELYSGADDKTKLTILQDLYPQSRQLDKIKKIFDKRLAVAEGVAEGSGGNWYIRVNGKILNDTKFKPVIFSSEDEARSHAMKLADKKRIPLSQMKLTKSWMDAPEQGVAEDNLKEFAPGNGGGESGRWYTDDQITDLVGDGWWNDLDISGDIPKQQMIQEAQAWLDDQGYSVHVLNCKVNDDDMEWFIEGSFQNSNFAKKGMGEASLATMRDYFAGDENARDPMDITKQRNWFNQTKDKNGRPTVDKRFRSPEEYQQWLKQNKLKQISDSEEYNIDEEAANLLEYLRKIHKRWAIVSKKEGRPLVYFKGDGRPSKEWVEKQERRINYFKHKK